MKIVKVTYTTQGEYAEQNLRNIKAVMVGLQKQGHPRITSKAGTANLSGFIN